VPGDGSGVPDETPEVGGTIPETEGLTPQQQGVAFAETLTCQTDCVASVATNGDVTVTTTSTTSTGQEVQTEISLVDTTVSLAVSTDGTTTPAGTVDLETAEQAEEVVTEITQSVPRSVSTRIALQFTVEVVLSVDEQETLVNQLKRAYAASLGVEESRFDIALLSEG
jgi:hypothetical protein